MKPSSADPKNRTDTSNTDTLNADTLNADTSKDVDALLRRALDGDSVATQYTVERLVRSALAAPESGVSGAPSRNRRRTWRLATAALGAAAVAALLVFSPDYPPSTDPAASSTASNTPPSRAVALEITNVDGPVTVIATTGSKMVFLPPVSSTTIPF